MSVCYETMVYQGLIHMYTASALRIGRFFLPDTDDNL